MTNQTTKICPQCGGTCMVGLTSTNQKICNDCKAIVPWNLEPGQQPTFGKHRPPTDNSETLSTLSIDEK